MADRWANFMVASVGAAAALTGLLFVAVSLRPAEIRSSPIMVGRARSAYYCFTAIVVAGLADLAAASAVVDGLVQAATALVLGSLTIRFTAAARQANQLRGHYPRVVGYYASLTALLVAGALRVTGAAPQDDQTLLGGALTALLLVGLTNSWELVITHGAP